MSEKLRKACEQWLYNEFVDIEDVVALVKQQRAEVWHEAAKRLDSYNDDMGRFDAGIQREVAWMEQQARELDA